MFKWRAPLVRCKLVGSVLVLGTPLGDAFDLGTDAALDSYLIFGYISFHLLIIVCPALNWALLLPCLLLVYSVTLPPSYLFSLPPFLH